MENQEETPIEVEVEVVTPDVPAEEVEVVVDAE